jgi:hypothetical protein
MRFGTSIPGQRNAYAKTIGEKWHFPFHDGIFDVSGYRSTTEISKKDHCEMPRIYQAISRLIHGGWGGLSDRGFSQSA